MYKCSFLGYICIKIHINNKKKPAGGNRWITGEIKIDLHFAFKNREQLFTD